MEYNQTAMKEIRIAAAQFQTKNGDKTANLARMEALTSRAVKEGALVVSFHEMCIPSYSFLSKLGREEIDRLAEEVPAGESTVRLAEMARRYRVSILAGLLEKEYGKYYNTYICVNGEGLVARYRKLHPFISRFLSPGDGYTLFELNGWRCGILICYDNNVIENVRATTLLGAEIIFMPHVTGCTPSPMPGRGWVDMKLWQNRKKDPDALRKELEGPKGRAWLMRWLPARAYDNGIYAIFTNPIGPDNDQVKNGNAMVLDPYGEVMAECGSMEDEVVVAACTGDKLKLAGGYRYRRARRPDLYGEILSRPHDPSTSVTWMESQSRFFGEQ